MSRFCSLSPGRRDGGQAAWRRQRQPAGSAARAALLHLRAPGSRLLMDARELRRLRPVAPPSLQREAGRGGDGGPAPNPLALTLKAKPKPAPNQVAMTDLLKRAPQRTWRPSEARLFFVPVWEFTSFTIGQCNGTPHRPRPPNEQTFRATTAQSAPVHPGRPATHACAPRVGQQVHRT